MESAFEKELMMYLSDMASQEVMEVYRNDTYYRNLQEKISEVHKTIRNQLEKEADNLIGDFDDMKNEQDSIKCNLYYRQGMSDCLKILRFMQEPV